MIATDQEIDSLVSGFCALAERGSRMADCIFAAAAGLPVPLVLKDAEENRRIQLALAVAIALKFRRRVRNDYDVVAAEHGILRKPGESDCDLEIRFIREMHLECAKQKLIGETQEAWQTRVTRRYN